MSNPRKSKRLMAKVLKGNWSVRHSDNPDEVATALRQQGVGNDVLRNIMSAEIRSAVRDGRLIDHTDSKGKRHLETLERSRSRLELPSWASKETIRRAAHAASMKAKAEHEASMKAQVAA